MTDMSLELQKQEKVETDSTKILMLLNLSKHRPLKNLTIEGMIMSGTINFGFVKL